MQKYEPLGRKMLVTPVKEDNYKTDVGIEVVQMGFMKVEVVEVSKEYSETFKPGDHIMIGDNAGISQQYNGKSCLWIDAKSAPEGDVWFIVREDEK
ncbi:MAG: hypothetical protein EBS55_12390 [Flavobacteriaceae bacterium]|jgi:hypothetical protein|nr:hypothetical protein [Flavobacteriaceae bacterium]